MIRSLALLFLLALAACGKAPDKLLLQPVTFRQMDGWSQDAHGEALIAFLKSCEAFAKKDANAAVGTGDLLAPISVWNAPCNRARALAPLDNASAKQFFEEAFVPFQAFNNKNSSGLFTGYYEPLLLGSRTQARPYVYPVYSMPTDDRSRYTRAQIDVLTTTPIAPVIVYVSDPIELFFLHIQGSGRIQLEDGHIIKVGYAGNNSQNYVSIGKVLADKGMLKKEDINAPLLKQWLRDHPNDMWQVMWENPSYVFFKETQSDAVGAQGVPLTAGRSLAVDAHYIPYGMPIFLNTVEPATPMTPMNFFRKLMIAQDTGGAIKGPVRGDVFFGAGMLAEQQAGHMKSGGQEFLLLPRELAIKYSQTKD